jgi:hypothetical protein
LGTFKVVSGIHRTGRDCFLIHGRRLRGREKREVGVQRGDKRLEVTPFSCPED